MSVILEKDNWTMLKFSRLKKRNTLTPKELIVKYNLNNNWNNSCDITSEIDKIAYNL